MSSDLFVVQRTVKNGDFLKLSLEVCKVIATASNKDESDTGLVSEFCGPIGSAFAGSIEIESDGLCFSNHRDVIPAIDFENLRSRNRSVILFSVVK